VPSAARCVAARDDSAAGGEPALATGRRRRGRFSFLGSGSGSRGDSGDAVAFLLRSFGTCNSLALSKAFQALSSSCDSGAGGGCEGCVRVAISRRRLVTPCRSATSKRRCHSSNSLRCCGVLVSLTDSSSSKGKSRSRSRRCETSCHTRAQEVSFVRPRRRPTGALRCLEACRGRLRTASGRPGSAASLSMSTRQTSQYQTTGASS
jgi:hypothetical protein